MKKIALTILLIASTGFSVTEFPDGEWEGTGRFKSRTSQHNKGNYHSKLTVNGNSFSSTVNLGGTVLAWSGVAKFEHSGFFTMSSTFTPVKEGQTAAPQYPSKPETVKGVCWERWCLFDGPSFSMTLEFDKERVYQIGMRKDDNSVWEASLSAK